MARPIDQFFKMTGRVLDCSSGASFVREYLSDEVELISTESWVDAATFSSVQRKSAYTCLQRQLNFIVATAEQAFLSGSFDWVHMRSMRDDVQVVDLAMLEARRVLKPDGRILVDLYVDCGKGGVGSFERMLTDLIKAGLVFVGINRWKDHRICHPSR